MCKTIRGSICRFFLGTPKPCAKLSAEHPRGNPASKQSMPQTRAETFRKPSAGNLPTCAKRAICVPANHLQRHQRGKTKSLKTIRKTMCKTILFFSKNVAPELMPFRSKLVMQVLSRCMLLGLLHMLRRRTITLTVSTIHARAQPVQT